MKSKKGITLIALIITVIIMLIIAGVTISSITVDGGLFSRWQNIAEKYNNEALNEAETVNNLIDIINGEYGTGEMNIGANEPKLVTGMKKVVFNTDGTTKEPSSNEEWYNYDNKQWANAETEDGSLWVWIPRFAYKITYYTDETKTTIKGTRDVEGYKTADGTIVTNTGTEAVNEIDDIGNKVKSIYGSIDVVFLKETGNQYYKEIDDKLILSNAVDDGYIIHPAFKDGRGSYVNGEWKAELTGFWIAKFEAGFQYGNVDLGESQKDGKTVLRSSVQFTQREAVISPIENGSTQEDWNTARNYIDGVYGDNSTLPNISYPVFKGNNYIMNYLTIGENYSLSRALNEANNPYGFSRGDSDTHLTKNSEWGATAYLGYSQYGLDGANIHINNKGLNNTVTSVYAVSGYAAEEEYSGNAEVWYTEVGQKGSNTGNITGVYDMSGATWERIAGYIANANEYIVYGSQFAKTTVSNDVENESTEYVTLYKHNTTYDNTSLDVTEENKAIAANSNYKLNADKYGDAIYETSVLGGNTTQTAFNNNLSDYLRFWNAFMCAGGGWNYGDCSGMFAYGQSAGTPYYNDGFRAVVCPL